MSRFGRYTLVRRVGTGGMAEIWKAKVLGPAGFEKVLAIKKVLPHLVEDGDFIDMFVAEAKLVADLVHPNIVQVFDFGQVSSHDYFIAMEYVAGCNLAMMLKRLSVRGSRLPIEVGIFIATEACKALGYAHSKTDGSGRPLNIVHRDISPQNILVSFGGEVKVTDFGIAKVQSALQRTAEGHVRGKLAYLSPEQSKMQTLDRRSDLFALGVVLYELVVGKRLFTGSSGSEIFQKVNTFTTIDEANLQGLPFQLQTIIRTALQPEPKDRYQDAAEMEHALHSALGSDGIVQARQALASIVQHMFDEERRADLTPEPSTVGGIFSHDGPTNIGMSAASLDGTTGSASDGGGMAGAASTVSSPGIPPPIGHDAAVGGSGLTLVPSAVRAVERAQPILPVDAGPPASVEPPYARWLRSWPLRLAVAGLIGWLVGLTVYTRDESPKPTETTPPRGVVAVSPPQPTATSPVEPIVPPVVRAATPHARAATPNATRVASRPNATVRPRSTPAPTPAPVVAAVGRGTLSVKAVPWAYVFVDDSAEALNPDSDNIRDHMIPAGKHTLRFESHGGFKKTYSLTVQPGDKISLQVDAKTGAITRLAP